MGNGKQKRQLNRAARRALKRQGERQQKRTAAQLAQAQLIANLDSPRQQAKSQNDDNPESEQIKFSRVLLSFLVWFLTLSLSAFFSYYGGWPKILYFPAVTLVIYTIVWSYRAVRISRRSKLIYGFPMASILVLTLAFKEIESDTKRLEDEANLRRQEHRSLTTNIPQLLTTIQAQLSNMAVSNPRADAQTAAAPESDPKINVEIGPTLDATHAFETRFILQNQNDFPIYDVMYFTQWIEGYKETQNNVIYATFPTPYSYCSKLNAHSPFSMYFNGLIGNGRIVHVEPVSGSAILRVAICYQVKPQITTNLDTFQKTAKWESFQFWTEKDQSGHYQWFSQGKQDNIVFNQTNLPFLQRVR